jgi:hypothetical protein
MPNQNNFRSDVTNKTESRFLASRVVRVPEEQILLEEIPGSFGYDGEDHIEVHFYTVTDNLLVLTLLAGLDDNIMKLQIVSYADGTYKTYLQIDFTKLFVDNNALLAPGDYRVVFNFFSDEIGSYEDRRLSITQISPTRTEVELQFNNETEAKYIEENNRLFREFIYKGFNRSDAAGILQKIFKQGVEKDDPTEGVHVGNVEQNLSVPEKNLTQSKEATVDRVQLLGIKQTFDQRVNEFIYNLFEKIQEEIVIKGDDRVQRDEMYTVVERIVKENIGKLQTTVDNRIKIS